jgi:tryptophanyl-tRNA synthetase
MEPDQAACKRLPGTDGKAKMSKSLGNCIYLSDDAKIVSKKVMTMFTDPTHLKVEDPGHTDNNPVFIYLDAFAKDEHFAKYLPQYQNLDALKAAYQKGGLGDVIVKRFLADVLNDILEPMRARRKAYEADIPGVYKILQEGSIRAEKKAAETLSRVRRALGINYFTDQKLIEKQSKTFKKQLADEAALEAYLAKQKKN